MMENVEFRGCQPEDLSMCVSIEAASYPADEAASPDAARYFWCAILNKNALIGFVCATRCTKFTHESMSVHDPSGALLAIHSVVVAEAYRRNGIATRMLKNYIQNILQERKNSRPTKIVLLAKAHLLTFYVQCGFQVMYVERLLHERSVPRETLC